MKVKMISWGELFKEAASKWNRDNAMRLAAALSFYTVFSLGPLLLLATGIAGFAFGEDAVKGQLAAQFRGLVGEQGSKAIEAWVASSWKSGNGLWATLTGLIALLIGATGAFAELNSALNEIWKVRPLKTSGIIQLLRSRLLSFGMVVVIGFLLLVSLIVSTVLAAVSKFLSGYFPIPSFIMQVIDGVTSLGMTAVLFGMIFKILPGTRVQWRDVAVGSVVTALLFTFGKFLIGLYLGSASVVSSFGASASVALIMLWTFYSSMILFYGAEFTNVYSNRRGSKCPKKSHADSIAA